MISKGSCKINAINANIFSLGIRNIKKTYFEILTGSECMYFYMYVVYKLLDYL